MGVHWKIQLLGGFTKNQYRGGDCLKRGGLNSLSIYKGGGVARKKEVFLRGDWYPNTHYESGAKFEEKLFCFKNLKRNFFVSKMTRIWWILIWVLKSLRNLHFDWSLLCKVYNVWPKKVQRSIIHDTEESRKIWRKTDLWFGK